MSKALYFKNLLESGKGVYAKLPEDKKFFLVLEMIKRGDINNYAELRRQLDIMGWSNQDFLSTLKNLWNSKAIGYDEIDVLDTHNIDITYPGFIGDKWLINNLGQEEICKRVPKNLWNKLDYCKDCK